MEEELREEIEWLEDRVETLEKHIRQLEYENHQLKRTIGKAIKSLENQNSEARRMVHGVPIGRKSISTSPTFSSYLSQEPPNEDDDCS